MISIQHTTHENVLESIVTQFCSLFPVQASQKTLPVAVAVLSEGALAAQLGPMGSGLAAISAVAAHLAQVGVMQS